MQDVTKEQIKELIVHSINAKIKNYKRETNHVPFFTPFVGTDMIATHSVMQSLYTSFGMSIYEQIAVVLANAAGYKATHQYDLLGEIDPATEALITNLSKTSPADKAHEIDLIRKSITPGKALKDDEKRVDVFITKQNDEEIYVDITTVKGNLKEFRAMRRKMLRWVGLRLSQNKNAKISTYIGLPYNPLHPEKYTRWTGAGNDPTEVLVQNDLWKLFAGEDVYDELIGIFVEVGPSVKENLDEFFSKLRSER